MADKTSFPSTLEFHLVGQPQGIAPGGTSSRELSSAWTTSGFSIAAAPLPTGDYLRATGDGTAWMALYCQNMLEIATEFGPYRT